MAVGYFFVYILAPAELAWHLGSSFDRLLLQLWPIVVFTYFMPVPPAIYYYIYSYPNNTWADIFHSPFPSTMKPASPIFYFPILFSIF